MALETELSLLEHEKELAAAQAEAEVLVSQDQGQHSSSSSHRPSASAKRSSRGQTSWHSVQLPEEESKKRTEDYVKQHIKLHLEADSSRNSDLNPEAPPFDWTSLLLKKELLLNRLSTFSDTPETYISWRGTFQSAVIQLSLTPAEQVDLLIKHLGPESVKQATSTKAANPETLRGL